MPGFRACLRPGFSWWPMNFIEWEFRKTYSNSCPLTNQIRQLFPRMNILFILYSSDEISQQIVLGAFCRKINKGIVRDSSCHPQISATKCNFSRRNTSIENRHYRCHSFLVEVLWAGDQQPSTVSMDFSHDSSLKTINYTYTNFSHIYFLQWLSA